MGGEQATCPIATGGVVDDLPAQTYERYHLTEYVKGGIAFERLAA